MSPVIDTAVYAASCLVSERLERAEYENTHIIAYKIKSRNKYKFGFRNDMKVIKDPYSSIANDPPYHAVPAFFVFIMNVFHKFSFGIICNRDII